ncbi:uncharacterized protein QYS62_009920 [Fusarium acuminatum]|uniref:Uncharacterized protein n=1 Tax=Fusarium acuminatum TaxID=5515 RepID=A0ABZ2X6K7_9HYPO
MGNHPTTATPVIKSMDQSMDPDFKAVKWSEDGVEQHHDKKQLVVRPVDKSSSYMDMLPWWNPDFESTTTLASTGRISPVPQMKASVSSGEKYTSGIECEKSFHDSLTKAGGRPWYSRELIDQVAKDPANYTELLKYWKQDPSGPQKEEWMVFERQLERWNQFRRYQLRVRRNSDTFEEYRVRCTKCLSDYSIKTPLHMKQDSTDQNPLSQWLEYLCFELSECETYSWYKRYHQQYKSAWQTLYDSKVLRSHETRDQIEDDEYMSADDHERTNLRQAVEVGSSNILLAERDLLNPSMKRPLAQRKLFEAQAELDSAIKAFDLFQDRKDMIKEYRRTTNAYREARRGARRHQILLRWVWQQMLLIEKELGLPCSTEHPIFDDDVLTETDNSESSKRNLYSGPSPAELVDVPVRLHRNESKKRSRLESIPAEATRNNGNLPPKRSRHGVHNGPEVKQ